MSISDYKTHIFISLTALVVLGSGTAYVIHFLNTGVSQPVSLQLSSKKSQNKTSPTSSDFGSIYGTQNTNKITTPPPVMPPDPYSTFDSSNTTPTDTPVPSTTYVPPTTQTTNTNAQQQQACQQEQTAQTAAIAPDQSQINQLQSEITTDQQQIDSATTLGGQPITQAAKDEMYYDEVLPLIQQRETLWGQEDALRSQYPTLDC